MEFSSWNCRNSPFLWWALRQKTANSKELKCWNWQKILKYRKKYSRKCSKIHTQKTQQKNLLKYFSTDTFFHQLTLCAFRPISKNAQVSMANRRGGFSGASPDKTDIAALAALIIDQVHKSEPSKQNIIQIVIYESSVWKRARKLLYWPRLHWSKATGYAAIVHNVFGILNLCGEVLILIIQ